MRSPLLQATIAAYARWSPTYPPEAHNPLMRAEQSAMLELMPDVRDASVLDVGCGSGRYARFVRSSGGAPIALDATAEMLTYAGDLPKVRADMLRLPFAGGSFDGLIAALAVGHAERLSDWVTECARVLKFGGWLLYSDFHPDAARAGMTRTFKDRSAQTVEVPHCRHEVAHHYEAAGVAGLEIETVKELRVGAEFRESFDGAESFYRRWDGLALLLLVLARNVRA